MKTVRLGRIDWFTTGINGNHGEAKVSEVGTHDAPHDVKLGEPAAENTGV
jgi:hypothetical protein